MRRRNQILTRALALAAQRNEDQDIIRCPPNQPLPVNMSPEYNVDLCGSIQNKSSSSIDVTDSPPMKGRRRGPPSASFSRVQTGNFSVGTSEHPSYGREFPHASRSSHCGEYSLHQMDTLPEEAEHSDQMDTIRNAYGAHTAASQEVDQDVASNELTVNQDLVETNGLYADFALQRSICSSKTANREALDTKDIGPRRVLEMLQVCECVQGTVMKPLCVICRNGVQRPSDMDQFVVSAMLVFLEPTSEGQQFCVLVAHVQKASCKAIVSGTVMSLSTSSLYAESWKASTLP
ncbi:hypothetical protein FGB62_246g09 [Gracilaria domingensis]|nr:hypothetical protein FGB62_246g09 [Gracilaria domingensis]